MELELIKKEEKKNKKLTKLFVTIAIMLVIGIGGTFAYYQNTISFENEFKTGKYGTEVTERFVSPTDWVPGDKTNKDVIVKNTGSICQNARVSYTESWQDKNGDPLPLEKNGVRAAIIEFDNVNDWEKKGDYYYYKEDIMPGQESNSFIKSVTYNPEVNNGYTCETVGNTKTCTVDANGYAGGTYTLTINVETVQCDKKEEAWTTTAEKVLAKFEDKTCNPTWTDEEDGTIYFSGTNDCVNMNYVWYSGKLWRITAIYQDGTMKLITEDAITAINWGSTIEYDGSWVYQWLNEDFYDTLYNKENIIVSNSIWNYSTDGNSTPVKPETIATQKTKTAPVGLLNAYEYYNAYRNASSGANYLNIRYYWWLITPYSASRVRDVYFSGALGNHSSSSFARGVRPSINLKSGVVLTGVGTKDNPYRIVGDMESPTNNVTLLSSRSSGEYVKFDGDLYRIVETSNGITKLTRVDYLRDNGKVITKNFASSVYFGKSANTQTDTYWDYYLNNTWYNRISSTYKNMLVDGTYYLGMYPYNTNYKATICKDTNLDMIPIKNCTKYTTTDTDKTFTGKVGLPRVGEMLSAQLGSGYSSSSNIWTVTPSSASFVRSVSNGGYLDDNSPSSYACGVRPSINLKSGIKITGGTGYVGGDTNSPFEISE